MIFSSVCCCILGPRTARCAEPLNVCGRYWKIFGGKVVYYRVPVSAKHSYSRAGKDWWCRWMRSKIIQMLLHWFYPQWHPFSLTLTETWVGCLMNTRVDTFILRLLFLNRYFPLEILFFLLFVCVLVSVCICMCVSARVSMDMESWDWVGILLDSCLIHRDRPPRGARRCENGK